MMLFRAGNNGTSVTLARRIGKRWQLWQLWHKGMLASRLEYPLY
jgi:hypothetical protein